MDDLKKIVPETLHVGTSEWWAEYGLIASGWTDKRPDVWDFPVGEGQYPPEMWYCATIHDPTGRLPQPYGGPRLHYGIDLNLDVAPWGDIERILGLSVSAIAPGIVHYVTKNWGGVGMVVIRHEHDGAPLWVRYAHITPVVMSGQTVAAGQTLGAFADWRTGDHLHFDCARKAYTHEYNTSIGFIDPVPLTLC